MRALLFALKTLFVLYLLVGANCPESRAQTNNILVVSPHVGEIIDKDEKERFNLFPFIQTADYQIGRFFKRDKDQIVLEIIKTDGNTEFRNYSQTEFELTGQLIDAKMAAGQPAAPVTPAPLPSQRPPASQQIFLGQQPPLTGRLYYVILSNGMKFFANIAERRADEYVFVTQYYGNLTAPFSEIRYLKEVENMVRNGEYWIPNPHDSRLFFGPTGRAIPAGEGYFQTVWGYLNSINYGVSNNFSIGGTFVLIPGLPLDYSIYSLTPKISLPVSKNASLAAGVLYASFYGENFGIVYGAGTIGNKNDNLTLGLGYGFLNDNISKNPVLMYGGLKRISNRLALMTENYLIPITEQNQQGIDKRRTYGAGLYGLRFIWPRSNLDLAGFYLYDPNSNFISSSYILPAYVSFTVKLGNRQQVGKAF